MKNILTKILKFSKVSLPTNVKASFLERFGDSLNVEWLHLDESYEAIFYLEEIVTQGGQINFSNGWTAFHEYIRSCFRFRANKNQRLAAGRKVLVIDFLYHLSPRV